MEALHNYLTENHSATDKLRIISKHRNQATAIHDSAVYLKFLSIVVSANTEFPIRRALTSLLRHTSESSNDDDAKFLKWKPPPSVDDIIPYITYPPFRSLLSTTHTDVLVLFTRRVTEYLSRKNVVDLNMALDALRSLAQLFPPNQLPSHIIPIEAALAAANSAILTNPTNKDVLSKACMVIANFNHLLSKQYDPSTIASEYSSTPMVALALLRGYVAAYPFDTVTSNLGVILPFYVSFCR